METITVTKTIIKDKVTEKKSIVLFNDSVNSFDYVIECLIDICGHTPVQAEQCTTLVHFKGKCEIKSGEYSELEPICTALLESDLSAEIQ